MAADVSDLIPDHHWPQPMTNAQRHSAAVSLAQMHPDKRVLVYFLCQLGLAEQRDDGCFVSLSAQDDEQWFSRRCEEFPADTFRLPPGTVDDCR